MKCRSAYSSSTGFLTTRRGAGVLLAGMVDLGGLDASERQGLGPLSRELKSRVECRRLVARTRLLVRRSEHSLPSVNQVPLTGTSSFTSARGNRRLGSAPDVARADDDTGSTSQRSRRRRKAASPKHSSKKERGVRARGVVLNDTIFTGGIIVDPVAVSSHANVMEVVLVNAGEQLIRGGTTSDNTSML
ncbi:hypothetical protein MRX96_022087 [Rhipicephalus microplus]